MLEIARDEAAAICAACFVRPVEVVRLDGEKDANFRIEDAAGNRYTLKLSPAGAPDRALALEQEALRHLEAVGFRGVPRLVDSLGGRPSERVRHSAGDLDARLLTWVGGTPLARVRLDAAAFSALLGELGSFLAELDRALASVELAAPPERYLIWDLRRLRELEAALPLIEGAGDRALVEAAARRYRELHERLAPRLPRSLVHHDANDHNILVSPRSAGGAHPEGLLGGLIDFGDLLVTETVLELAVAAAYAGCGQEEPWAAVEPLVAAYDRARPLGEAELELLPAAVRARLAQSVLMAARRRHEGSADAYALVSERAAWGALRRLAAVDDDEGIERLRPMLLRARGSEA